MTFSNQLRVSNNCQFTILFTSLSSWRLSSSVSSFKLYLLLYRYVEQLMNFIISILQLYHFNIFNIFSIDISVRMLDSPHPVVLILHGSYRQQIFSIFDLLQNIAMRLKLCLVFIGYIRKR